MISTPPSIEFGAKLAEHTPGDLKHVFFTTGGSTAVDSPLRFVQFYFNSTGKPQKKHIITREYAYHGSTYLSASVSGKPSDRGYLDVQRQQLRYRELRESNATQFKRVEDLRREIDRLTADPSTLERIAREDLNFVGKGELTLLLPAAPGEAHGLEAADQVVAVGFAEGRGVMSEP